MSDTRRLSAVPAVAAAWVVIAVSMLLIGWLLTHPWASSIGHWDDDVERWLAARRTDDLDRIADVGTFLGNIRVTLLSMAVVAAAVSVWQRSPRPAVVGAVLVGGGMGLYLAGTQLVPRDRPPVPILDPGLVPDHSFPSGHVIAAVVLYDGAALLVSRTAPRTRRWVLPLLVLPVLVALARMYQGAHHPTDVLTGLVVATAWVVVVTQLLLPRPDQLDRERSEAAGSLTDQAG